MTNLRDKIKERIAELEKIKETQKERWDFRLTFYDCLITKIQELEDLLRE